MKNIAASFFGLLTLPFFMHPALAECDLFKCEEDFQDCILKECSLERGKKHKKCIKKKCKYSYEDCVKTCKDTDDDDEGLAKIKAYLQNKSIKF